MIDDDTLTLFYYGDELDSQDNERIAAAIEADSELAERYQALCSELDALASFAETTTTAPAQAVVRWRYELDKAAGKRNPATRPLAWLLATAAVLALGIAIGVNLGDGRGVPQSQQIVNTQKPTPAPLTRGVSAYLRNTQVQLAALKDVGAEKRGVLIADIVEQNRLLERSADANGDAQIARVLRAFEQLLVELARADAAPDDVAVGADQLAFEFAAVLTRLSQPASDKPYSL